MPQQTRVVSPGPAANTVRTADGQVLTPPADWSLLPPGDAGLTRRVKAAGPTWTVQEKKGRRMFSRGVLAPTATITAQKAKLEQERSTDAYAKRQASSAARREKEQGVYVEDFRGAVLQFLRFDTGHRAIADRLADAVTEHATPVGSGTVARTKRIPIEQRAESAVIAWLRHQTTAYDHMKIERVKGKRREVRRMLADESRRLLTKYRRGEAVNLAACPLARALTSAAKADREATSSS